MNDKKIENGIIKIGLLHNREETILAIQFLNKKIQNYLEEERQLHQENIMGRNNKKIKECHQKILKCYVDLENEIRRINAT